MNDMVVYSGPKMTYKIYPDLHKLISRYEEKMGGGKWYSKKMSVYCQLIEIWKIIILYAGTSPLIKTDSKSLHN